MQPLKETETTLISEGTEIEGKLILSHVARMHGRLKGQLIGTEGSQIILCEESVVEGAISGDTLYLDGYVRGDIEARTKVVVSRTGRVIGNIHAPSLIMESGAHLEGKVRMLEQGSTLAPQLSPA